MPWGHHFRSMSKDKPIPPKKFVPEVAALHRKPERDAAAELKRQVLEVADEVFDRYVWGESFQAIADSLPFKIPGWKLRQILCDSEQTRDQYTMIGIERAHNLVDAALDYGRTAAAIGTESGLKAAIDVNLKVASKLHAAAYGDKSKVELTGKDGGPVKLLAMTDEELLKIASQAAKEQAK
jgi:hypothetical protein